MLICETVFFHVSGAHPRNVGAQLRKGGAHAAKDSKALYIYDTGVLGVSRLTTFRDVVIFAKFPGGFCSLKLEQMFLTRT